MKFKIGDIAFLKGGSGALTVIALLGKKTADVEVMWFTDMNQGCRAVLSEDALITEAEFVQEARQQEVLNSLPQSNFRRCQ